MKACVTGHRPKSLPWGYDETKKSCIEFKKDLYNILEKAIQNDYSYFIYGGAIGIDQIFAETVLKLKKKYSNVVLECVVPCKGQESKWREEDQKRYKETLDKCDSVTTLHTAYTKDCMNERNKFMVDRVDVVIAVWNGKPSGTGNTVRMAKESGKKIRMINPDDYRKFD